MKVSVAMATYNGANYLPEQLESLVRQSRRPDELVVTDDDSSDETMEVLERFAQSAPFLVRIQRNEVNLGYAQNFGEALSLCTGDLIFPCDQDDAWFEDKIASMRSELDARPDVALLLCDTVLTDAGLRTNGLTKLGLIRANGLPDGAHVMGCCIAMRRSLLDLALPIPGTARGHDNWIVKLADELDLAVRLEQPLQYYRQHGHNASDFYVNRADRLSAMYQLSARARRFARRFTAQGGMEEEHLLLEEVLSRLGAHEEGFAELTSPDRTRAALASLTARVEALGRRLAVRTSPRLGRLGPVLSLWRAGAYGPSRGIAAAAKDLLVPPTQGE